MKKINKRRIYTKNDAGNIFLLALLFPPLFMAIMFWTVIPLIVLSNPNLGENFEGWMFSLISVLIAQLGLFLVYVIYNKSKRFNYKKASKLSFKIHPQNVIIAVVIGLIVLFGLNNLIGVVDEFIETIVKSELQPLPLPLDNIAWLAVNLLVLALAPAISEELVFRGVVFNGLRQYSKKTAIIVSALLFALLHANMQQTVYPILFGLVLAYIVLKTNNIFYAIVAHFTNNAAVIIYNYLVNINIISKPENTSVLNLKGVLIALAYCAVALVAVWLISKLFKKDKVENKPFILEDLPHDLTQEQLDSLASQDNPELPQGANPKAWEQIFCQKNDVFALQTAKQKTNTLLWAGVIIGALLWLTSI